MTRAWLTGLVRARQVQEDVARARLADARRHEQAAHRLALTEQDRVEGLVVACEPTDLSAFVAAAAARQAAAATLRAVRQAHAVATDQVAVRQDGATAAARQRRSAEKLAERDAAEARARAATAMQNELDDIGTRGRPDADRRIG